MNNKFREIAVVLAGIGVFPAAASGTTAMISAQGSNQSAAVAGSNQASSATATTASSNATAASKTASSALTAQAALAAKAPSFGTSSHITQASGIAGSGESESGDD